MHALNTKMRILLEQKLQISNESDYRLYGGIRATLVFHPQQGIPNNEELDLLCRVIQPMMYTQLWRNWVPFNIPESTKQIDVIGFEKHNFLCDEDEDIALSFKCKSSIAQRSYAA